MARKPPMHTPSRATRVRGRTRDLVPPGGTSPRLPRNGDRPATEVAVGVTPVDSGRLRSDQRAGEFLCIDRAQVLERLPDPDQLHRDAELRCDREGDSAL